MIKTLVFFGAVALSLFTFGKFAHAGTVTCPSNIEYKDEASFQCQFTADAQKVKGKSSFYSVLIYAGPPNFGGNPLGTPIKSYTGFKEEEVLKTFGYTITVPLKGAKGEDLFKATDPGRVSFEVISYSTDAQATPQQFDTGSGSVYWKGLTKPPETKTEITFNPESPKSDGKPVKVSMTAKYFIDGKEVAFVGTNKIAKIRWTAPGNTADAAAGKEVPKEITFPGSVEFEFPDVTQTIKVTAVFIGADGKEINTATKDLRIEGTAPSGVTKPPETDSGSTLGPVLSLLSKLLSGMIWLANGTLYVIFYSIIAPFIEAMLSIHTYTNNFAAIIYPGWEILRNLSNIFFIIALLIIALTTIFRVQGYQWKHMLVELVIAAVLVNFSLIIGQGVLGIAETVQNQFMPNNQAVIRSLGGALMYAPVTQDISKDLALTGGSGLGDLITPLFYLALAIGSFLTFFAIAIMLVVRMVMLWILLMLSPIAYAARVLHATEHFAKEWWDKFLKYAFFVPIMALFLNIAALIVQKYPNVLNQLVRQEEYSGGQLLPLFFKAGATVIVLIFLIVAIKVANAFSIIGAKGLTSMAENGVKFPFEKIKQGAQYAGKGVKNWASDQATDRLVMPAKQKFADMAANEKSVVQRTIGKTALLPKYLSTKKHMRDEEAGKSTKMYEATLHDAAHGHGTDARDRLRDSMVGEHDKKISDMSSDEALDYLKGIEHAAKNQIEKQAALFAVMKKLGKDGDVSEILTKKEFGGIAKGDINDADKIVEGFENIEKKFGLTENTAKEFRKRTEKIAKEEKQFQLTDIADKKSSAKAGASNNIATMKAEQQTRVLGKGASDQAKIHGSVFKDNSGGMNHIAVAMAANLNNGNLDQSSHGHVGSTQLEHFKNQFNITATGATLKGPQAASLKAYIENDYKKKNSITALSTTNTVSVPLELQTFLGGATTGSDQDIVDATFKLQEQRLAKYSKATP